MSITHITGGEISKLINDNKGYLEAERVLANEYDCEINFEEYSSELPRNYATLIAYKIEYLSLKN